MTPDTWAEKNESLERINSIRETNGNFDSCNSCKWLGTSRLHYTYTCQNFRLFHVSNLSVRNFRILLMYTGSMCPNEPHGRHRVATGIACTIPVTSSVLHQRCHQYHMTSLEWPSRRSPLAAVCDAQIARPRPHLGVYKIARPAESVQDRRPDQTSTARPAQSFTSRRHGAVPLTDPVLRSADVSGGGLRHIRRWGTQGGDTRLCKRERRHPPVIFLRVGPKQWVRGESSHMYSF